MIAKNNPANVRWSEANKWQGADTPAQERGYCRFKSPAFGVRALAIILVTAQDRHECRSISDHIQRYAPPSDGNPTDQYIRNVATWTGFPRNTPLDMHTYAHARPVVEAIIRQEQGKVPYSATVIDEGLRLAGIVLEAPTMTRDPKVIAATVVTAATAAQQVVANLSDVWDGLGKFGVNPHYLMIALGLAVATVGVWFALDWWKRRGIA